MQHHIESVGELGRLGHLIGQAGVADLGLGAHDALGERGSAGEEGAGDLLGGEPAHFAERQRDLRVGRERRMAAGEDEPEPVVLDRLIVRSHHLLGLSREPLGDLVARGIEAGIPADAVDRLEAAGGHQPRPRVPWHAVARPLLGGSDEGVVERFLGALEIAEKADQRRENAA